MHDKGCRIWCQLWALGRGASPQILETVGSYPMSSSAVPMSGQGSPTPVEMTEEDIQMTSQEYVQAAKNAIAAGFDGVELHG